MLGNLLAAKGPSTICELWMEQNVPAAGYSKQRAANLQLPPLLG